VQYGVRDVEKLLGLPASTIRALITAGFVTPTRGPRNAFLFSFQDLIVLRTAAALVAAKIPNRRIMKSLRELRRDLPASMPLSGLSISAVGDRVVVKDGTSKRQVGSGQYLLAFEGDPSAGSLAVVERKPVPVPAPEEDVPSSAEIINRAVALHEARKFGEAKRAYIEALETVGADSILLFNLGVLLEDMHREHDAMKAYEGAVRVDPEFADAHYNLGLLCDKLGKPQEALRHMAHYRRITKKSRPPQP
jgi:tetratricopeptide (TPR) repeat protein